MTGNSERSIFADVVEEFGSKRLGGHVIKHVPKYKDGVRCNFNPNCRKVNTSECDLGKCLKKVIDKAKLTD
jgi:hypothetical protein